jgi:hypothetical protein
MVFSDDLDMIFPPKLVYWFIDYSVFDSHVQGPLAYARGAATAAVRERLNVQTENALNRRAKILAGDCASRIFARATESAPRMAASAGPRLVRT